MISQRRTYPPRGTNQDDDYPTETFRAVADVAADEQQERGRTPREGVPDDDPPTQQLRVLGEDGPATSLFEGGTGSDDEHDTAVFARIRDDEPRTEQFAAYRDEPTPPNRAAGPPAATIASALPAALPAGLPDGRGTVGDPDRATDGRPPAGTDPSAAAGAEPSAVPDGDPSGSAVPGAAAADSAVPDSAVPDSAVPDSGAGEGDAGEGDAAGSAAVPDKRALRQAEKEAKAEAKAAARAERSVAKLERRAVKRGEVAGSDGETGGPDTTAGSTAPTGETSAADPAGDPGAAATVRDSEADGLDTARTEVVRPPGEEQGERIEPDPSDSRREGEVEDDGDGLPAAATGRRKAPVLIVVALLLVAAASGAAAFWFQGHIKEVSRERPSSNLALLDSSATAEVVEQVSRAVEAIYSYDASSLDADEAKALSMINGSYAGEFKQNYAQVRALPPAKRASLRSKVVAVGVITLTERRASLLVMLDQEGRQADKPEPQKAAARLSVTAQRVDGQWKVSGVNQK